MLVTARCSKIPSVESLLLSVASNSIVVARQPLRLVRRTCSVVLLSVPSSFPSLDLSCNGFRQLPSLLPLPLLLCILLVSTPGLLELLAEFLAWSQEHVGSLFDLLFVVVCFIFGIEEVVFFFLSRCQGLSFDVCLGCLLLFPNSGAGGGDAGCYAKDHAEGEKDEEAEEEDWEDDVFVHGCRVIG